MPPQSVFWPIDVNVKESGYVFGWQNRDSVVVAGTCAFGNREDAESALTRTNELLLTKGPLLQSLGVCSGRGDSCTSDGACQHQSERLVIYYRRPKYGSMRHYSLVGIDLDLFLAIQDRKENPSLDKRHSESQTRQAQFVVPRNHVGNGIDPLILSQMNTAHRVMDLLTRPTGRPDLIDARDIKPRFNYALSIVRSLCQAPLESLCFLRARLHVWGLGAWLYSFMASAQQLDLRIEQIIFVLRQAWLLDGAEETSNDDLSAHYISTQNCIWLILNDIIIGSAVGMFLVDNRDNLARIVHHFATSFTVVSIRKSAFWLDNWPAGLKLNTELSCFLYLMFTASIDMWEVVLKSIDYLFPTVIAAIGMSGLLGMTMILAFLSDFLSVLSIHLSISYTLVRVAFRTQLLMAKSLFNLFRGKRYNTLRRRLDDWDYDLDQLLLGAMLLTLINFLFPTISIYYMLFALSRLAVLILHSGFTIALALLNHFPLFVLTLRIKDPWRLPGGIVFHTCYLPQYSQRRIIIQNLPIALSKIFSQYYALGSKLAAHYNPKRLMVAFLKGNRLDPVPQSSIRYTYGTHDPQHLKPRQSQLESLDRVHLS